MDLPRGPHTKPPESLTPVIDLSAGLEVRAAPPFPVGGWGHRRGTFSRAAPARRVCSLLRTWASYFTAFFTVTRPPQPAPVSRAHARLMQDGMWDGCPELSQWAALASQQQQPPHEAMDTAQGPVVPSLFSVPHHVSTVLAQRQAQPLKPLTPRQPHYHYGQPQFDPCAPPALPFSIQQEHAPAPRGFGSPRTWSQPPPPAPLPKDGVHRSMCKRSVLERREHLPTSPVADLSEGCGKRQKMRVEQSARAALPPLDEDGSPLW